MSATVWTPRDLDPQRTSELTIFRKRSFKRFRNCASQPFRGCDPKTARVGTWTGGYIGNGARARLAERQLLERKVKIREFFLAHPRQVEILIDRHSNLVVRKAPDDLRQKPRAIRCDVAQLCSYVHSAKSGHLMLDHRIPNPREELWIASAPIEHPKAGLTRRADLGRDLPGILEVFGRSNRPD